jgi:hypothetical protein
MCQLAPWPLINGDIEETEELRSADSLWWDNQDTSVPLLPVTTSQGGSIYSTFLFKLWQLLPFLIPLHLVIVPIPVVGLRIPYIFVNVYTFVICYFKFPWITLSWVCLSWLNPFLIIFSCGTDIPSKLTIKRYHRLSITMILAIKHEPQDGCLHSLLPHVCNITSLCICGGTACLSISSFFACFFALIFCLIEKVIFLMLHLLVEVRSDPPQWHVKTVGLEGYQNIKS